MDKGKVDPAIREMLRPGEFHVECAFWSARLYRIAALKHAYLAACLHLGFVPGTPSAHRIRSDLLRAREALSRADVPSSDPAARLEMHRSYAAPQGPPLGLVQNVNEEGEAYGDVMISLAGVVLVSWPFDDVDPLAVNIPIGAGT
jgi:hypothetical protein